MVVTPGDILARCRALDARINNAARAIESAPKGVFDAEFKSAWDARSRRWQELRGQCADWSSRMWNWKWEPRLDDWINNQAAWEKEIEQRSGLALPVPAQTTPDEEPKLPELSKSASKLSTGIGVGVGIAAVLGVSFVVWNMRKSKG